jgi:hypothetical protein
VKRDSDIRDNHDVIPEGADITLFLSSGDTGKGDDPVSIPVQVEPTPEPDVTAEGTE